MFKKIREKIDYIKANYEPPDAEFWMCFGPMIGIVIIYFIFMDFFLKFPNVLSLIALVMGIIQMFLCR